MGWIKQCNIWRPSWLSNVVLHNGPHIHTVCVCAKIHEPWWQVLYGLHRLFKGIRLSATFLTYGLCSLEQVSRVKCFECWRACTALSKHVRCGSENTEYFKCLQGLKHGCLASPTLFSPFINELAQDIISQGKHGLQFFPNDIETFIMLFVDDVSLLFFHEPDNSSTISTIQITEPDNSSHNAANRLRLQVNFNKTKVMFFWKGVTLLLEKDGTMAATDWK